MPSTLLACVHATKTVLADIRGRRFSGVRRKFGDSVVGVHHLRTSFWDLDIRTQAEMLASWSRDERMISEPGGKERARERLAKSWVVDGPITGVGIGGLEWGSFGGGGRMGKGLVGKDGER